MIEQEVKATSENKALMAFLAERRANGNGIPTDFGGRMSKNNWGLANVSLAGFGRDR